MYILKAGMVRGGMKAITTTIPYIMWEEAKNKRIPLQHIFMRGWQVLNSEPQLQTRLKDTENTLEKLQKSLEFYKNRLYLLESEKNV